jgi:hypothetical protein
VNPQLFRHDRADERRLASARHMDMAKWRTMVPFDSTLTNAIGTYGAWIVGGTVAVESMGIPVPGETMLVAAAVYAGTTGELSVAHVVLAAIIGAIVGDNAGFWIGRTVGFRWVGCAIDHGCGSPHADSNSGSISSCGTAARLCSSDASSRYFVHWLQCWPGSTA